MIVLFIACTSVPIPDDSLLSPVDFFATIGNIEDDQQRYDSLEEYSSTLDEGSLKNDVEMFLEVYEQWAYGRERFWVSGDQESSGEGGYLGGFFIMRVLPGQVENAYPPLPSDPLLHPLWADLRGRMLIWTAIEND